MRTASLLELVETFSLSSDSPVDEKNTPVAEKWRRPPELKMPTPKENDECYGSVLRSISANLRTEILRSLIRPIAVIFREGLDPRRTTSAFAALENKYFHPDSDDDTLFHVVIDQSGTLCPIVTLYVLPEQFFPQLMNELSKKKLSIIQGAPVIGTIIFSAYDPSAQIKGELGVDIEQRLYTIDSSSRKRVRPPRRHRVH